ncbi:hypothetical protein HDU96_002971 [Phlyctochytrium bullatum]|nr:hypothetical protein HDU96_002971 [Phlyctochytrium bullatum]
MSHPEFAGATELSISGNSRGESPLLDPGESAADTYYSRPLLTKEPKTPVFPARRQKKSEMRHLVWEPVISTMAHLEASTATSGEAPRPRRRRASCEFCSRKKIRCFIRPGRAACSNCLDRGIDCSLSAIALSGEPESTHTKGRRRPSAQSDQQSRSEQEPLPGSAVVVRNNTLHPPASIPRRLTPFDDLPALPSEEIRNLFYLTAFNEPLSITPIISRADLRACTHAAKPLLFLSIQTFAGSFAGLHAESASIFDHLSRIMLPGLFGVPMITPTVRSIDEHLWRLQAVTYFIPASLALGKISPELLIIFTTALGLAREIKLYDEVTGVEPELAESKRRAWLALSVVDTHLAVGLNTPPLISEEELGLGHLPVSESTFEGSHRPDTPPIDEVHLTVSQVIQALDHWACAPPHDHPTTTPPEELRPYWSRNIAVYILLRRAVHVSIELWRPNAVPPSHHHPALLRHAATLRLWFRATEAFHEIATDSVASAGMLKAGTSPWIHATTAGLLAISPRWAIDVVFGSNGPPQEHLRPAALLVLTVWAASAHAQSCRELLKRALVYWVSVLAIDGAVPSREITVDGSLRNAPLYDLLPKNLWFLNWDLVYAFKVLTAIEALGVAGVEQLDFLMARQVFTGAAVRLMEACPAAGLGGQWKMVEDVRASLMAAGRDGAHAEDGV